MRSICGHAAVDLVSSSRDKPRESRFVQRFHPKSREPRHRNKGILGLSHSRGLLETGGWDGASVRGVFIVISSAILIRNAGCQNASVSAIWSFVLPPTL
jgi:hypothetical protein